MLIYNYQKEFLGIDKKDLNILGFSDLASLKAEVSDFADLFVKTPGYIHNFKHVHWIDFIACAESSEKPKAIIHVNSRNFKCTLDIKTIFLVDEPSSPAYLIHLFNLHPLSEEESNLISADIANKVIPKPVEPTVAPQVLQEQETLFEPLTEVEDLNIDEFDTQESPQETLAYNTQPLLEDDDDFKLDVHFDDETEPKEETSSPSPHYEEPQKVQTTPVAAEEEEDNYVYDPHVASSELGLPLDLIEEFIQDFIVQAKEFKADLYRSLDEGDIENVKILSHKLKGVAANLRVEDAFEVLATINTTSDISIIKPNLDRLYRIIAKLAGEEVPAHKNPMPVSSSPETKQIPQEQHITEEEHLPQDTPLEIELEDFQEDSVELQLDNDQFTQKQEEENKITDDKLELDFLDEETPTLELKEDVQETQEEQTRKPYEIHYSKANIASEIGIDTATFEELLQDYETEAHTIFETMLDALDKGDTELYNTELTKFKGMTENVRIKDFTTLLDRLDGNYNKDEVSHYLQEIGNIISQIIQEKE